MRAAAFAAARACAIVIRRATPVGRGRGGVLVLAGGVSATALCAPAPTAAPAVDYAAVYRDIAAILDDESFDDGSWGPILLRLAWHAAGTYDSQSHTGGSNGATMRHAAEAGHGANAGLAIARKRLEGVKARHPSLSFADLWSLAGVVAIQQMGGPLIPWSHGRTDSPPEACTPDGRLPSAAYEGAQGAAHISTVFEKRMGFTPREVVALLGAHSLGRCHKDRSGFVGPWTNAPTTFSNEYFRLLLEEVWQVRVTPEDKLPSPPPRQYEDARTQTLMMLPSDMALIQSVVYKPFVVEYAHDKDAFFRDFTSAFVKLQTLGCKNLSKPIVFKALE